MHLNLLLVENKIFDQNVLESPTSLRARGDFPRPVNVCDAVGTQGERFGRRGEGSPTHSDYFSGRTLLLHPPSSCQARV